METCKLCGQMECDCAKKNLDEDFLAPTDEPTEVEGEEEKPSDEEVESEEPVEPEEKVEESEDWMKSAAKHGWVPDHVREKFTRESQTLRDQVENLQRIVNAARRKEEEERDPNEGVTRGELDAALGELHDKAMLSEKLIRLEVEDYDATVQEHLVPLARKQPWLEEYLYNRPNPAREAYKFACALRDGKKIKAEMTEAGLIFTVDEGTTDVKPTPVARDKTRPPVAALEQASKQPKSIDSVPSAKSTEATEMSVEDFWNLPTDTLIRIRTKQPELYQRMQLKSQEQLEG